MHLVEQFARALKATAVVLEEHGSPKLGDAVVFEVGKGGLLTIRRSLMQRHLPRGSPSQTAEETLESAREANELAQQRLAEFQAQRKTRQTQTIV